MQEPTYNEEARTRRLIELLRALAARIRALEGDEDLLAAGPELLKLMGDARSELFHYEVRCTYDSPEVAESRRIVDQARKRMRSLEFTEPSQELESEEGDEPWRGRQT
jgi:hypothetical protein